MTAFGFTLSSEEIPPEILVNLAQRAEKIGFDFAMMSDHYHPWTSKQGNASFVWSVLGAVAATTDRMKVGTAVTCPIQRIHPAIIAQAAATTARMFDDRFMLGVGSGENLSEHILGDPWPAATRRIEMLEEAIEVMRELWKGETVTHRGRYYTVDEAKLFTLPETPPPILVAATGPVSARLAGRRGDGLVSVAPDPELTETFQAAGADGPRFAQVTCCYGKDESEARKTALEYWPNSGMPGDLPWETKTVDLFDAGSKIVREEDIDTIICGPNVDDYLENVAKFEDAGYDHIWLHQVGPDQNGFLDFCDRELLNALRRRD